LAGVDISIPGVIEWLGVAVEPDWLQLINRKMDRPAASNTSPERIEFFIKSSSLLQGDGAHLHQEYWFVLVSKQVDEYPILPGCTQNLS